jgi:hypothetical protein
MGMNKHMTMEVWDIDNELEAIYEALGISDISEIDGHRPRSPEGRRLIARATELRQRLKSLEEVQRSYNQYLEDAFERGSATANFADHVEAFERIRDADKAF